MDTVQGAAEKVCWHVQPKTTRSKMTSTDARGHRGLLRCSQGKSDVDLTVLRTKSDPAGTEEVHQGGTKLTALFISCQHALN